MIDLVEWRERLQDETDLRVHGVLTEDLARRASQRTGDSAFLSWLSDRGAPSEVIGLTRQLVTVEVAVLLRVTRLRGPDQGLVELARVRRAVRTALLGWEPDGADGPVEYVRGQVVAAEANGVQWWQDVYATLYLITEEA